MRSTYYMIPCPIVEWEMETIPAATIEVLHSIDTFVVERLRTARRFISKSHHPIAIDDMTFFEYDKHDPGKGLIPFLSGLPKGTKVGILSEAGCPGIADPGRHVIAYAHQNAIEVVPLVGPSSILLALMASGFNGQQFTFHGYLPHHKNELQKKLKDLERASRSVTQIFMEAPYRNQSIIENCAASLSPQTLLCVACDINAPTEDIKTMPLSAWAKQDLKKYHKRPTIFLLGTY